MFLRPQLIRGGGQGLGLLPLLLFLPEACPEHQLCPSIIAGPPPPPYTGDAAALGSACFGL